MYGLLRSVDVSYVCPLGERFKSATAESNDYAMMEKCPGSTFPIMFSRSQDRATIRHGTRSDK